MEGTVVLHADSVNIHSSEARATAVFTEKVTGAEQSVVGPLENRVLPSPGTTVIAAFPLGRRPSWALLFDPFLVVFMRTDCDRK